MVLLETVKCPYCGHELEVEVSSEHDLGIDYCRSELGGCGKTFVTNVKFYTTIKVFKIQEQTDDSRPA